MLATIEDLEIALETSLSGASLVRAEQLLKNASAAVVAYTGQQFLPGTSTVRLSTRKGFARLGQTPVTAVTAVEDPNGNPMLFTWDGADRVYLGMNVIDTFAWEPFRTPIRRAKVTYTHGDPVVPDDIKAVVLSAAGRAFGVKPQDTAVSQETIGQYNYSTGSAASSGAIGFLLPERAVLDRYVRAINSFEVTR